MENQKLIIRPIDAPDIPACLAIYNEYIRNSTITFEETPLTESLFQARVSRITTVYPYLVAVDRDRVVGYAYLDQYNERSAYRFTADLSIYLDSRFAGRGIGSRLLEAIEAEAHALGLRNIISIITEGNQASRDFHEKHGYRFCGRLERVGYKLGRWLGVDFYQHAL